MSTPSKLIDVVSPHWSNCGEWKILIKLNLGGMGRDGHLSEECPTEPNAAKSCNFFIRLCYLE